MTYQEALRKSITWAILGLLIGSLVASLLFDLFILPHGASRDVAGTIVRTVFIYYFSLFLAAPATLLYGWPLFSFLLHKRRHYLPLTMAIPLLPAALVYPYAPTIGQLIMLYGACIALFGHLFQRVRSNNSFKPKPLRGSA